MDGGYFNLFGLAATLMVTTIGSVWSLSLWLTRQFSTIRDRIDSSTKSMEDKLEYHERHDDTRFEQIRKDIWNIRIENASRGGLKTKADHGPSDEDTEAL